MAKDDTWSAFEARRTAAEKAFWSKKALLLNAHAPLARRLKAFYRYVGSIFLYGSEGWILTQDMAKAIRTWNYNNIRQMRRMRRQPRDRGHK